MQLSPVNLNIQNKTNFGHKIFEITSIDGLPCAYCGKEMISFETINDIFRPRENAGTDMLNTAREYGHLLTPFRQQVLNYLTRLQYEYGLETDGEIIAKARELALNELNSDVIERFIRILDAIENSNCRKLKDYVNRNRTYCYNAIKRKNSYEALIDFVRSPRFLGIKSNDKRGVEGEINAIVSDIENPHEFSMDAFIIRKTNTRSASEFYHDLFEKAISSTEHLLPQAKGGQDKMSNFLAVCRQCNSSRGSIPFFRYIDLYPNAVKNTTEQITILDKMLPKLISDKKIDESYEFYPQIVSKSLKRMSQGKIDIKV